MNSCDGVCAPDLSNLTLRRVITAPAVEIGGVRAPPENVLFAGLAPQFVGLYQINLTLPMDVPVGDAVPVVIRQGAGSSRADVMIAIEASGG